MKVYVTGVGCVSAIGVGVEQNLDALRQRKHGMGKVSLFPTELDMPVAEVKFSNRKLKEILSLPVEQTYSRTALLGMLAAREAWEDAGINSKKNLRIGFISSTSVGGMDLSENFYTDFKKNAKAGRLRNVIAHDCGSSTEEIASFLGIDGFITTVSTACSSASNAIMLGVRLIKQGYLDVVIAGGTDSLCKFTLNGFNSLMILDKEHCRPYDDTRAGLNLGEGAGYLVLQGENTQTTAPRCELSGYANVNEAYHQTGSSPDGDGPFEAMAEAINISGIAPQEVSYINVHGTGTPNNDASEGRAIQRIFRDRIPPFSSVKAFIGHTLGASEGIEAVYSVLSAERGIVYPNLNFTTPIGDLHLVPEQHFKEGLDIRHVLSNSFGFGGNNSSLLFSTIKNH